MFPTSYAEQSYQNDLDSDALRKMIFGLQGYSDPGAIGEAYARNPKAAQGIMDYFSKNYATTADAHARATNSLANLLGANANSAASAYGADARSQDVLNQVMGQQNTADIAGRYDLQKAQATNSMTQLAALYKYLTDIQTTQMKGQQDLAKELYKPIGAGTAMAIPLQLAYSDLQKKNKDPIQTLMQLGQASNSIPGANLAAGQRQMVPGQPGMSPQPYTQAPNIGALMSQRAQDPQQMAILRMLMGGGTI